MIGVVSVLRVATGFTLASSVRPARTGSASCGATSPWCARGTGNRRQPAPGRLLSGHRLRRRAVGVADDTPVITFDARDRDSVLDARIAVLRRSLAKTS
jgi:hypothetical protein